MPYYPLVHFICEVFVKLCARYKPCDILVLLKRKRTEGKQMTQLPNSVTNVIKWIEEAREEGNDEDFQDYLGQAKKILVAGKKQFAEWKPGSGGPGGLAQLKAGIEHLEDYLSKIEA